MKWKGRRQSSNVSRSKGGGVALGGGGLLVALIVFFTNGKSNGRNSLWLWRRRAFYDTKL